MSQILPSSSKKRRGRPRKNQPSSSYEEFYINSLVGTQKIINSVWDKLIQKSGFQKSKKIGSI